MGAGVTVLAMALWSAPVDAQVSARAGVQLRGDRVTLRQGVVATPRAHATVRHRARVSRHAVRPRGPASAATRAAWIRCDLREDVWDAREDVRDRAEDIRDRREDRRDARVQGGIRDRLEDVADRREDRRDRAEDVRDRREDRRDRAQLGTHPSVCRR